MKTLMIILSGVSLVNNQPETITELNTATKTIAIDKLHVGAEKIAPGVKKALKTTKKKNKNALKNKKTVQKKTSQKKKKVKSAKKKVVKKKTTKKIKYNYRFNVGEIQSYAHNLVRQYGWSEEDYQALVLLWNRESSWNPYAVNKKSGACGIPQANPCSKATKGTDYKTNWKTQVKWGLNYIKKRYGSPSEAWSHRQQKGWY